MLPYSVFGGISFCNQRDRRSRRCWLNNETEKLNPTKLLKTEDLTSMHGAGKSALSPYANNVILHIGPVLHTPFLCISADADQLEGTQYDVTCCRDCKEQHIISIFGILSVLLCSVQQRI
jgi:hypothetical protein